LARKECMKEFRTDLPRSCGTPCARATALNVHAVRVEREAARVDLSVVDRHEDEVHVGLRPDRIVRQAAAENRGEDGMILSDCATRRRPPR